MAQDQNVHFKELNQNEIKSKLALLAKPKKNKIIIWKKGEGKKISLLTIEYIRSKNEVQVQEEIAKEYINQEMLFSFELSGLHFFGTCKPIASGTGRFYLDCNFKIFKSERRANFRLLTYPHQKVYASVYIGAETLEASNVYSMKTGMNETGLFKNFLDIVEEGEKTSIPTEGYHQFRVIDISVTGLALLIGEMEKSFFPKDGVEIGKFFIDFNGDLIEINNGKLLYKIDFVSSQKATKMYKGGIQFLDVDTNLDGILAKKINSTLRSLESEFEDFLK